MITAAKCRWTTHRRADRGDAPANFEHVPAVGALDSHTAGLELGLVELVLGAALFAADVHPSISLAWKEGPSFQLVSSAVD